MGRNVEWAQGVQKDIVQRRASWMQELGEAQDLWGKEALLVDIVKEEMAHQTEVSVLSQVHLHQAEEIKVYSEEIKHLSTLLERQQAILEKVQEHHVVSLKCLVLGILQHGLRNVKGAVWNSTQHCECQKWCRHCKYFQTCQNILVAERDFFEDELAKKGLTTTSPHHTKVLNWYQPFVGGQDSAGPV